MACLLTCQSSGILNMHVCRCHSSCRYGLLFHGNDGIVVEAHRRRRRRRRSVWVKSWIIERPILTPTSRHSEILCEWTCPRLRSCFHEWFALTKNRTRLYVNPALLENGSALSCGIWQQVGLSVRTNINSLYL